LFEGPRPCGPSRISERIRVTAADDDAKKEVAINANGTSTIHTMGSMLVLKAGGLAVQAAVVNTPSSSSR
jgi:hypothetical protein